MSALKFRTPTGHQFFEVKIARAEDSHRLNGSLRPVFSGKIAANYLDGDEPWGRTRQFTTTIMEREHARQLETLLLIPGVATVEGDIWDRRTSVFVSSVSKSERAGGAGQVAVQFTLIDAEPDRDARALVLLDAPNGVGFSDLTATRSDAALALDEDGVYQSFAADAIRLPHFVDDVPYALHEPGATNLLLRSEELDNASWTKNNTTIDADARTAPDGEVTADGIEGGGTSTTRFVNQAVTVTSGVEVALSTHGAPGDVDWIYLQLADAGDLTTHRVRQWFNLATGVVGTSQEDGNGTLVDAYFDPEALARGYYRPVLVATVSGTTSLDCRISPAQADNNATSGASSGVLTYAWGHQAEEGHYATSYIATTTATASRDDEAWTLDNPLTPGKLTGGGFVLLRSVHLGAFTDEGTTKPLVHIGVTGSVLVETDMIRLGLISNGNLTANVRVGGVSHNSDLIAATVAGWKLEDRIDVAADIQLDPEGDAPGQYKVRLQWQRNGGGWTAESWADAFDLPAAWSGGKVALFSRGNGTDGVRTGLDRLALFDRTLTTEEVEDRFHV